MCGPLHHHQHQHSKRYSAYLLKMDNQILSRGESYKSLPELPNCPISYYSRASSTKSLGRKQCPDLKKAPGGDAKQFTTYIQKLRQLLFRYRPIPAQNTKWPFKLIETAVHLGNTEVHQIDNSSRPATMAIIHDVDCK
uniref:Uncharacterized protein n=1 Tax=Glossina palpalis gambiensis TaxID=67801 RepID=A0A1B0C636_9MUSC